MPIVFADSYQLPNDEPSGADQFFTAMLGGLTDGVQRARVRAEKLSDEDRDYERRMAELTKRIQADRETMRQNYEMQAPERELRSKQFDISNKMAQQRLDTSARQEQRMAEQMASQEGRYRDELSLRKNAAAQASREDTDQRFGSLAAESAAQNPALGRYMMGGAKIPGLAGVGPEALRRRAQTTPGVASNLAEQEAYRLADQGGLGVQAGLVGQAPDNTDFDLLGQAYKYRDMLPPKQRQRFMEDMNKRLSGTLERQQREAAIGEQQAEQQRFLEEQRQWMAESQRFSTDPTALVNETLPPDVVANPDTLTGMAIHALQSLGRRAPTMDPKSFRAERLQIFQAAMAAQRQKQEQEMRLRMKQLAGEDPLKAMLDLEADPESQALDEVNNTRAFLESLGGQPQ
jgi:hypothetical protein